jgi:hypothetical protein
LISAVKFRTKTGCKRLKKNNELNNRTLKTRTKKCFNCKDEFTPFNTLQKFCLKNECIKAMVEIQKLKEWLKKKKKLIENLKTSNDYLKIAQQVFNKFIRFRDRFKLY